MDFARAGRSRRERYAERGRNLRWLLAPQPVSAKIRPSHTRRPFPNPKSRTARQDRLAEPRKCLLGHQPGAQSFQNQRLRIGLGDTGHARADRRPLFLGIGAVIALVAPAAGDSQRTAAESATEQPGQKIFCDAWHCRGRRVLVDRDSGPWRSGDLVQLDCLPQILWNDPEVRRGMPDPVRFRSHRYHIRLSFTAVPVERQNREIRPRSIGRGRPSAWSKGRG